MKATQRHAVKKRHMVYVFCAVIFLVAATMATVYSQEDLKQIDNSVFSNPVRPPCVFNHDRHNETAQIDECGTCHHVVENGVAVRGESSEDSRCSDCHAEKSAKGVPLMKAFHKRCKSCHQEKKAGPVMCGECHKK